MLSSLSVCSVRTRGGFPERTPAGYRFSQTEAERTAAAPGEAHRSVASHWSEAAAQERHSSGRQTRPAEIAPACDDSKYY